MKQAYQIKTCQKCGERYQPTGPAQKYCVNCGIVNHKEKYAAKSRTYYSRLSEEKRRAKMIRRHETRSHEDVVYSQNWQKANPEKTRICRRKHEARRHLLGFVPLNEWFVGCEGHHINDKQVIYMPKELHHSIYHRQSDGRGMVQINALAVEWLAESSI